MADISFLELNLVYDAVCVMQFQRLIDHSKEDKTWFSKFNNFSIIVEELLETYDSEP